MALAVAQWMVIFLKRPGGQAQFSVQLSTQMADRQPLRDMQAWFLDHPGADLSVEALARRVNMSPRNFFRVFVREVGMTPGCFVERVRVEAARRLLRRHRAAFQTSRPRAGSGARKRCAWPFGERWA